MDIVAFIKSFPDYIGANGKSESEIKECEDKLNAIFAPDYRKYLEETGVACFDGKELTGICSSKRLNVVDVTLEARAKASSFFNDLYVVEQTNINGIVIWQDKEGKIYQVGQNGLIQQCYKSLSEYFEAIF